MRFTSVRVRLTLWNVGILALALLVVLGAVYLSVRAFMLGNIDQRLERMSERHVIAAARGMDERRFLPPPPAEDPGSSRSQRSWRTRIPQWSRIFNLKGEVVTRDWQPAETQEPPWDRLAFARAVKGSPSFSMVTSGDGLLRVYSRPLLRDGKRIGVVQMVFPLHEMQVMLDGLTIILLVLVPCVLLLAGIGGLFLTDRALRPVRDIARAADTLTADDLSRRLSVVGADEFAHLAETVNRMIARLEEAFLRLKESIERERRFTADASHELRTPLTAIKANTSLALRGERTPAQYREALAAIDQASGTMQRLVQDLLLLARSDNGQLGLECRTLDPRDLCAEVVALTRREGEQAAVRVEVAEALDAIWGDPHHLQRLLVNLLENALHHTPADGEVLLAARQEGTRVVLTVTDTGDGIAPEHLPHLGERFYRIDAARARKHGGSGLGLAICCSIVSAHQGEMTIDSAPGDGTRVTITLPGAPPEEPA